MPYSRSDGFTHRTRVGGSGFTAFFWNNHPIPFCRQLAYVSPTPVGPGPTPIQPLDEPYVVDIITPAAQTIGTLTLELYELYNKKVWDHLGTTDDNDETSLVGEIDLVNIFIKLAASKTPLDIKKVIWPPQLVGQTNKATIDIFHDCKVTNVEDGETIEIGTMEITKRVTLAFARATRTGYDHQNNDPKDNRALQLQGAHDDAAARTAS